MFSTKGIGMDCFLSSLRKFLADEKQARPKFHTKRVTDAKAVSESHDYYLLRRTIIYNIL